MKNHLVEIPKHFISFNLNYTCNYKIFSSCSLNTVLNLKHFFQNKKEKKIDMLSQCTDSANNLFFFYNSAQNPVDILTVTLFPMSGKQLLIKWTHACTDQFIIPFKYIMNEHKLMNAKNEYVYVVGESAFPAQNVTSVLVLFIIN